MDAEPGWHGHRFAEAYAEGDQHGAKCIKCGHTIVVSGELAREEAALRGGRTYVSEYIAANLERLPPHYRGALPKCAFRQ
jgi:hypothetical protein